MLDLPIEHAAAIARHGERAYPEECCGVMLGTLEHGVKRVRALVPMANIREDEARARRYLIAPEELRDVESRAEAEGLDIVGFYHSHPDHPAIPSAFDRDHAWPWWSYVIVSVRSGSAGDVRVWQLDEAGAFEPEPTAEPLELFARVAG